MAHLPVLIEDLSLILMAAAFVTIVCKKLKQPVVLGYLLAGFLVGPHFALFPSVKDTASISTWAEIGVIFMLFGLGLEFSFKKLSAVGKSASIAAIFEIVFMSGLGYFIGQALNWSKMDSLFLGGILSVSSTTIIVRAFEELGLKGKNFVSLVFGILIVEDVLAILLMVLLSSIAVTQTLSGSELTLSSLRLVFFIILWFILGIYILPILLRKYRDFLSDETMLVVSIGLCLMMVIVASHAGFSPALGAFVMGSIFAETPKGYKIEQILVPVKDLFSAVFFVSVGMMIDLKVLADNFWIITLISVVTVVGKFFSTGLGALVSGKSVKTSVQTGLSVSQIGEFSFIIATLGMTLKVTSDFLYPIAVTVSAITTFTTPYLIKLSDPFSMWFEKYLPAPIKASLARYEKAMAATSDRNILSVIWQEHGVKVILNSVVVIAITLGMSQLVLPNIGEDLFRSKAMNLVASFFTFLCCAPFLWAIFFGKPTHKEDYKPELIDQLKKLQLGVTIVRFFIGIGLIGFIISNFISMLALSGIVVVSIAALGGLLFSRYSEPIYTKIEERFVSNLTANERAEIQKTAGHPELAPWDATLMEFVMSVNSPLIGQTLMESRIKENYGVTVTMIERGEQRLLAPNRDTLLFPGDKLFLIGTEEQLTDVKAVIERKSSGDIPHSEKNFGLSSLVLLSDDIFINKSIRDCGIREAVNGLIVGIERKGERFLNPDSSMVLLAGDLIWLVGDKNLIKQIHAPLAQAET